MCFGDKNVITEQPVKFISTTFDISRPWRQRASSREGRVLHDQHPPLNCGCPRMFTKRCENIVQKLPSRKRSQSTLKLGYFVHCVAIYICGVSTVLRPGRQNCAGKNDNQTSRNYHP